MHNYLLHYTLQTKILWFEDQQLIIKENEQKKHAEDFINPVKLIATQIEYRILWQTEMKSH